jgi:hypothetical protein
MDDESNEVALSDEAIVQLEAAQKLMADAEALLRTALLEIKQAPRSKKITMSAPLRSAFEHLFKMKTALSEIEAQLAERQSVPPT